MSEKEKQLKALKEELKDLRAIAAPINAQIYLKECEIYSLEEALKK